MTRRWNWMGACALTVLLSAGCGVAPAGEEERPEAQGAEQELSAAGRHGGHGSPGATLGLRLVRGSAAALSVAHASNGDTLVLARFSGAADFGTGPVTGGDLALARYRPDGSARWVRVFTVSGANLAGMAVDRRGHIVLAGDVLTGGSIDFGTGPLAYRRFLVKLDGEGRLRWARQFLGEGFYLPREVVTDGAGNIALAGVYNGSVDFGQGPVPAQRDTAFLARFSPDGSLRWSRTFPEPLGSEDPGLAVDEEGVLYLSATRVTLWTGDGSYYGDPFLVRVSPRGDVLWTRRIEGAVGLVQQVAVRGSRVVVTGYFQAPFTFAGQTVAPQGRDAFLVSYSTRGEERWARGFGFWGHAVDFTPQGEVVLAGEYANGDTLEGVPLTASPGAYDRPFFVASFEGQDGRLRWVRSVPSQSGWLYDVSAGPRGESVVVGNFQGPIDFGEGPVSSEGESGAFLFRLAR